MSRRTVGTPTIVYVTTVPMTLRFFRRHVRVLRSRGIDVAVVSSPEAGLYEFAEDEQVRCCGVPMTREISPMRDVLAIIRLCRFMRRTRPHIVHSHTPKAGVLAMVAARLSRVPLCVYTIHGLPSLTATGLKRRLLMWTEKVSCGLADRVLCVSASLKAVAEAEHLCAPGKSIVLGAGSVCGVDGDVEFSPSRAARDRSTVRERIGIPSDGLVIGFVGRLVNDKGVRELAEAWGVLRQEQSRLHLLIVGPTESHNPLPGQLEERLRQDNRVHMIGLEWNTAPLYAAMDVLCLPSYREGFPIVPLEAAAMQLPVVATRVPGCIDAVQDGVTGALVAARDATALTEALRRYLENQSLRMAHGAAGRERVLKHFRADAIAHAAVDKYVEWLGLDGATSTSQTAALETSCPSL